MKTYYAKSYFIIRIRVTKYCIFRTKFVVCYKIELKEAVIFLLQFYIVQMSGG